MGRDGLLSIRSFSDEETVELCAQLLKNTVKELTSLAKSVSVKLAGSTHKAEIVDRLIALGKIGAIQGQLSEDSEEGFTEGISYITDEVRSILKQLS